MSNRKGIWAFLLIFATWVAEGHDSAPLEVLTKYGRLRGQQVKVSGAKKDVNVFLGIPYAKPPTGNLRFAPPVPAEPWSGLRDATSYPASCLQDPVVGQDLSDAFTNRKEKVSLTVSEDCLYLNVYTVAHLDTKPKLPVMVWIHGGGLSLGAASTYDGSALAAYEDVVVVTIQYRLGILGFYSSGDTVARGNWGLLDQVAALQWVQENIADFGGDPGSVTIFGESAGGFSTCGLVISPLAKGLFHKAISESGVCILDGLMDMHPEKHAKKISEAAGCKTSSSSEMVDCLKEKTEDEILQAVSKMRPDRRKLDETEKYSMFSNAVVDGVFFPKLPTDLLAEKKINNVPYMIGVNNHESGWTIPYLLQFPDFTKGLDRTTVNAIIRGFKQFTSVDPEHAHIIADEYLKDIEDPIQLRDQLLDMVGDVVFVAPAIQTARYHRDAGYPAYVYEFQHRSRSHGALKPDFVKVDHGDEIFFVLGGPFLVDDANEEDKNLSKTVMKYWSNFARTGNPNGDGLPTWPKYDQKEQYLAINLKQKAATKLREKQVAFWTKILPEKIAESKRVRTEL
ncbi:fatty acyl-CoA hydrolase precursor, medium chain-like [Heteronotia binoei]|uniref:fatty acyl-CoA hydrolase precursor, medium chain-like n=1 Tax=Heteronotia binoei TaxID=13085 RepID=UPI002931F615|nr:fatty acyl-CoA hydrolase precursor, medium chain-like [Heteronotia binoei]